MTLDEDLEFAFSLADAADRVTLEGFFSEVAVELKPDRTPVTKIDRDAETAVRDLIAAHRPDDAVHGEEHEDTGESSRRWVIDPIDGTKNFIRGVPVWASLISLSIDDEVVVSVVSAPALNRRWWAVRGGGAYTRWSGGDLVRERRLSVSAVAEPAEASFSYSSMEGWTVRGQEYGFLQVQRDTWRSRAFGDFWSYMLVAEGAVDIAAEPEVPLYDLAAVSLIVQEAGGRFTNVEGLDGPGGGSAVASNHTLHNYALQTLNSKENDA